MIRKSALSFLPAPHSLKAHNWRYMWVGWKGWDCIKSPMHGYLLRPLKKERRKVLEFLINRDDQMKVRTGKRFGKFGGC